VKKILTVSKNFRGGKRKFGREVSKSFGRGKPKRAKSMAKWRQRGKEADQMGCLSGDRTAQAKRRKNMADTNPVTGWRL
jgi:hypothetical protein